MKGGPFGLSLPWPDLASGGFRIVSKKWTDQCEDCSLKKKQDGNVPSRRHILGSKIFKEQLLDIFGKNYFFSKELFLNFFFEKSIFQDAQCRKTQKEAIQAHSTFSTNRKLQKNARGYPLIKFENFRKKSHFAEKKPRGGPFGLTL